MILAKNAKFFYLDLVKITLQIMLNYFEEKTFGKMSIFGLFGLFLFIEIGRALQDRRALRISCVWPPFFDFDI